VFASRSFGALAAGAFPAAAALCLSRHNQLKCPGSRQRVAPSLFDGMRLLGRTAPLKLSISASVLRAKRLRVTRLPRHV
jgi:hypothetical protein